MTLNPELLAQRLMRGALRGAVAIEETTPMSRCKGKLESGERCAIHAAPGKDRCMSCEARGAEFYDKIVKAPPAKVLRAHDLVETKTKKKPGRPAKKGALSEAEQELQEATKPGLCVSCAGEGTCDGFGTGQTLTECAAYLPAEQNIPENIPDGLPLSTLVIESDGVTDTIRTGLPSSVHAKLAASVNENHFVGANEMVGTDHAEDDLEMVDHYTAAAIAMPDPDHIADAGKLIEDEEVWVRDDARTQAILGLIGCTVSLHMLGEQPDEKIRAAEDYAVACHVQASDNDDVEIPPMPFFLKGTQTYAPESQISPVAATPPQEAIAPCAESSSTTTEARRGLAALLRAPSAPPSGLFIPFAPEEIFVLDESEVTPELIRQFILMGLEGKLCAADSSDPLAKTRHAAA